MEVLLGITQPSKPVSLPSITFFDESLNESQKAAVKFTLESPEVACIHGPPGTGKTHTLIEIIRQLTSVTPTNSKPQRLLVCGASNLSVDNILERLLALPAVEKADKLKVTRVGHPARVMAHQGVLESTLDAKAGRSEQVLHHSHTNLCSDAYSAALRRPRLLRTSRTKLTRPWGFSRARERA